MILAATCRARSTRPPAAISTRVPLCDGALPAEAPALREVVPGHLAACHLHDGGVRFPLGRHGFSRHILVVARRRSRRSNRLRLLRRLRLLAMTLSGYTAPRSRGSRTSRMPSPSRLKASTVRVIAAPGKQHQPPGRDQPGIQRVRPACCPRSGVGGGMPTPRKPSAASMMMATPRCVVARIR